MMFFRKYKPKSEFGYNFLTLLTGSGLSQLIVLATSPILTRYFVPEEFGVSALFLSITSILLILSTCRYEMAIVQVKENLDGLSLSIGTLGISMFFFVLSISFLLLFSDYSKIIELNLKLEGSLFWVPIYVLTVSFYKVITNYLNREKEYRTISINQVGQSFFQSISKLFLGVNAFNSNGLIMGTIIGQVMALILFVVQLLKTKLIEKKNINSAIKRIKTNFKRFIDFPKFMLFSDGINVVAAQMPFLLTSYLFSLEQLGLLALAYSMSSRPLSFLADSLSKIFRQQAATDYNNNGRCDELFLAVLKKLSFYLIFPFVFIFFAAPFLFKIIFGEEWYKAGIIVRLIIIMFYFRFLARILGYMYILTERQKENLILQATLLIGTIVSFGIGYFIFSDLYTSLIIFSFMYSLIYIFMIYRSYIYSKGKIDVG